ncbi:MAG: septal ring lytic transglycosylase RlpA family protein [Gammaproteobacteria bacterium]|jgi:rare lipoprotein A
MSKIAPMPSDPLHSNTGHGLTAALLAATLLAGCSSQGPLDTGDYPPPEPRDISGIGDAVPRAEPRSRYGNPASYVVNGRRYHTLASSHDYRERGIASWYGTKFHGRRTSSGEIYDLYKMTAAHKTLPLPTYARVTNLRNGRSIIVKINDRGPFHVNRIIDLSYVAAAKLGILEYGTGLVEVEAIDPSRPAQTRMAAQEPAATGSDATLFLQVGAFRNRDNAERLSRRLQETEFGEIHIMQGATTGGTIYRVRIGPLASVDAADRVSNSLISLGISDTRVIID